MSAPRKSRGKSVLIGCGLVALGLIVALAVLEWGRRRQVAAARTEILDGSGTVVTARGLEEQYRDPQEFARLCANVKERNDALKERFLHLRHTRGTRLTSYDAKGEIVAVAVSVSSVRFRGGVEQKKEIERHQLAGKPSIFDPDRMQLEQSDTLFSPPFSKDSPEGLYRYQWNGVEELRGRLLLRVHFEPTKPMERSFKGSAWIDPETCEPVRMAGSLAKKKLRVDRFDMILDYGPSENGHNQLRRVVMDMAGGFALFSLHYRLEHELSDYCPAEK
ncbi:MAG: hypothetical protein ACYC3I_02025 [Gemmataceae bacterium]